MRIPQLPEFKHVRIHPNENGSFDIRTIRMNAVLGPRLQKSPMPFPTKPNRNLSLADALEHAKTFDDYLERQMPARKSQ